MEYLTALTGGALLGAVPLLHRIASGRGLAVSGRYTALVDRALDGAREPDLDMSNDEFAAALEAAALAAFTERDVASAAESAPAESHDSDEAAASSPPVQAAPQPLAMHALFLVAMAIGRALSLALLGEWSAVFDLRGVDFHARYGAGMNPLAVAALLGGGVLVGFGTRMAGGCTSGHGLCGVSRGQPGSLVATAAFFGTAVAFSLLLAEVLS